MRVAHSGPRVACRALDSEPRVACRALRAARRAARTLGLVLVLGLVYGSPGIQQMRKHYTSRMAMNCWDVSHPDLIAIIIWKLPSPQTRRAQTSYVPYTVVCAIQL